ncbi:MAG TPA: ABC transporter ATP-binding protein [Clostridia bacterium]|nr:ABC transporter ATP-binding protein [Clostridia bacterium]
MKNAIEVNNLTKKYKGFLLDNISFAVPSGFICGFIGQNGAGKTTTMKLMLDMALKDGGDIELLERSNDDVSLKEDLGVLFDQPYFQEDWTPVDIEKAMCPFYKQWNSVAFHQYLQKFSLSPKQKYKTMSRGMKMKLGMAVTLSHDAKLLLLDEPTSGLDPVMRDEMLDIFRDYMVGENKSVFFSTHITSDLEKIADYIVYINKGRIVYSGLKDELTEKYALIRGGIEDLPESKRKSIIGLREHIGGFEGMIEVSDIGGFPPGVVTETVSLDDIMVHMNRNGAEL